MCGVLWRSKGCWALVTCFGGQATPLQRSKQAFTHWLHALELRPRSHEEAIAKTYGLSPVISSAMETSSSSTHGWMASGSVLTCGP